MNTIKFLRIANTELLETFNWYEEQGLGLGYQFIDAFNKSINLISTFPEIYNEIQFGIRRCIIKKFPYGILYKFYEKKNEILVIAIYSFKREPNYWIDRIQL